MQLLSRKGNVHYFPGGMGGVKLLLRANLMADSFLERGGMNGTRFQGLEDGQEKTHTKGDLSTEVLRVSPSYAPSNFIAQPASR